MRHLKLISLLAFVAVAGVLLGSAATAWAGKTTTRYLVFLEPGSAWDYGVGVRRQAGYAKHTTYYRKLFKKKKVTMVGTVKGQNLGLILAPAGASKAAVLAWAKADPLVKTRVLAVKVREWKLDFEGKIKSGFSEEDYLSDEDLEDY